MAIMTSLTSFAIGIVCLLGNVQGVISRCVADNSADWTETTDPSYPSNGFPHATARTLCRTACRTTEKLNFVAIQRRGANDDWARCYCLENMTPRINDSFCSFRCGIHECGGPSNAVSAYAACPWYRHGVDCALTCPETCSSPVCQVANGNCRGGCKEPENINCAKGACDPLTGVCTEGCKRGWHADFCTSECPANCTNNRCDQATGVCTEGCDPGWYTDTCTAHCPKNCAISMCDQETGQCKEGCEDTYYGAFCELSCSGNCAQKQCTQDGGLCLGGCMTGWTGDMCDTDIDECSRAEDNACVSSDVQLQCQNLVGSYLCCGAGLSDGGDRCADPVVANLTPVWVWAVLAVFLVAILALVGAIAWLYRRLRLSSNDGPVGHAAHHDYITTQDVGLSNHGNAAYTGHVDSASDDVTQPAVDVIYERMIDTSANSGN